MWGRDLIMQEKLAREQAGRKADRHLVPSDVAQPSYMVDDSMKNGCFRHLVQNQGRFIIGLICCCRVNWF